MDASLAVWAVTLNGDLRAVCDSHESAGEAIDAIKDALNRSPRTPGRWRAVGPDAWSADQVTLLKRQRWSLE